MTKRKAKRYLDDAVDSTGRPTRKPRPLSLRLYDAGLSEVQVGLIRALRLGATRSQAAMSVGISPQHLTHFVRQGERGIEPYQTFIREMVKAEARPILRALRTLDKASRKGSWRSAAAILAHVAPRSDNATPQERMLVEYLAARTGKPVDQLLRQAELEWSAWVAAGKPVADELVEGSDGA